jgi:hypothetical protein
VCGGGDKEGPAVRRVERSSSDDAKKKTSSFRSRLGELAAEPVEEPSFGFLLIIETNLLFGSF